VAIPIIEGDEVLIAWFAMPQVQIAICGIVSVWLIVYRASQPPWGAVRCSPCLLILVSRVHGIGPASPTMIVRTGDIDDPVRSPERACGGKEGLPIISGRRREELGTLWAAVLLCRFVHIETVGTFDKTTCGIVSIERNALALGTSGAAIAWLGWNCVHAAAWCGLHALRHSWQWLELCPLVSTGGRIHGWEPTCHPCRDFRILDIQELGAVFLLLASVDFAARYLAISKGFDEAFHSLQATPFSFAVRFLLSHFPLEELEGLLLGVVASGIGLASILCHDGVLTGVSIHQTLVLIALAPLNLVIVILPLTLCHLSSVHLFGILALLLGPEVFVEK